MVIGPAEVKLGFDVFSKLIAWATGKRESRAREKLKSEAWRELLRGESADLVRVEAILRKLQAAADHSADSVRLEKAHGSARRATRKKPAAKRTGPKRGKGSAAAKSRKGRRTTKG